MQEKKYFIKIIFKKKNAASSSLRNRFCRPPSPPPMMSPYLSATVPSLLHKIYLTGTYASHFARVAVAKNLHQEHF